MIISPNAINFSKYKRFFTYGCSFTEYIWPTWSNILKQEMPSVEYYNLGMSGAGNIMISNRIVESNLKFKFNEYDLIIVMWSTFCREDRWITGRRWVHPGNIFTQREYDDDFVKKFADPTGYLIRDMAQITLTLEYLKNNSCDAVSLMSVPIDHQQDIDSDIFKNIKSTYDPVINTMPGTLYSVGMNNKWVNGHIYYSIHSDNPSELYPDYHPNPNDYCRYLQKIGFNLSESTINYANINTEILQASTVDPTLRSEINHKLEYNFATMF